MEESSARPIPVGPRKLPRANSSRNEAKVVVQKPSAPMNIPDWSKIYGGKLLKKGSSRGGLLPDDGNDHDNVGDNSYGRVYDKDDDDDDGDDEMVPPHEWIAGKLARSRITSFSVCEGMGRTLKGRDLCRVRNAIWTKTGFLE